jgi:hypothetical protein
MKAMGVVIKCTDGLLVRGKVNIGDRLNRVSDWFNSDTDPFLTIFQAEMADGQHDVLIINKDHIVWARPLDG